MVLAAAVEERQNQHRSIHWAAVVVDHQVLRQGAQKEGQTVVACGCHCSMTFADLQTERILSNSRVSVASVAVDVVHVR